MLRLGVFLYTDRLRRFLPEPAWTNSNTTISGLSGGASFWLTRISISLDATWSTVAPKTAPTVGLNVDLITSLTVEPSLIASLPACRRVCTPFIATDLKNCATLGMNRTIPRIKSPTPWPYCYLEVPLNTGISKPLPR